MLTSLLLAKIKKRGSLKFVKRFFLVATAQAAVCRDHRGVLSDPLQPGGGEEDLRGGRNGEVRGSSGGARKRASGARSSLPLRKGEACCVCVRRARLTHS